MSLCSRLCYGGFVFFALLNLFKSGRVISRVEMFEKDYSEDREEIMIVTQIVCHDSQNFTLMEDGI